MATDVFSEFSEIMRQLLHIRHRIRCLQEPDHLFRYGRICKDKLLHPDSVRFSSSGSRAIYSWVSTGKTVRIAHSISVSSSKSQGDGIMVGGRIAAAVSPQEAQSLGVQPFFSSSLI